jgi:hypothetical protein
MRAIAMSPRDRQVAVLGAIAIGLLVGVSRGFPAWRQWDAEARTSAVELTQEAERARVSVAHRRSTHDSLMARKGRFLALAPLLVAGASSAMGSASLASLISTTAMASNVRLGPLQVSVDTVARGVFTRVSARGEITGDVRGLGAFLSTLERGPTLLAVREIAISQLEPAATPERAEALRVTLTVEGLMLTPPRAKKAKPGPPSVTARSAP